MDELSSPFAGNSAMLIKIHSSEISLSEGVVKQPPDGIVVDAWEQAFTMYKTSFKPEVLSNLSSKQDLAAFMKDLEQAKSLREEEGKHGVRKKLLTRWMTLAQWLDGYSSAVGGYTKVYPEVTALVWGSFRFLLKVRSYSRTSPCVASK